MGAIWISWRATVAVIILLQSQALISGKVTTITKVEGQTISFRCEYPRGYESKAKYLFCNSTNIIFIRTDKHNQWETNRRFSLYDNTTGAFFIVKLDKLVPEDSRTYICGVDVNLVFDDSIIKLHVSRAKHQKTLPHYTSTVIPTSPKDLMDKRHMPLLLTAVMCMAAMLFVCLFSLCLLRVVKQQRSGPRQNREVSSDYETMMPDVGTETELHCTSFARNCADLSPAPPDLCLHFTSKQRESIVTLGLGEYVEMDVPGHICQYQHLDLSTLEEHIYHSINGICSPKDGHLEVKQQINS